MQSQSTSLPTTSLHDAYTCGHGVDGFCPDCAVIMAEEDQDRANRRSEQIRRNRPIISEKGSD